MTDVINMNHINSDNYTKNIDGLLAYRDSENSETKLSFEE